MLAYLLLGCFFVYLFYQKNHKALAIIGALSFFRGGHVSGFTSDILQRGSQENYFTNIKLR